MIPADPRSGVSQEVQIPVRRVQSAVMRSAQSAEWMSIQSVFARLTLTDMASRQRESALSLLCACALRSAEPTPQGRATSDGRS